MLKASLPVAFAAILLSATAFVGPAAAEDAVIARIDGQAVTELDLGTLMAAMTQQLEQLPVSGRRKAAFDRLIDMRVIAGQASKDGIDKSDDFKRRLETIRQQLLISEFVKLKVDSTVTDAMLKARYDKDSAGFNPPEETRARHILVKTKEEAEAVIKELDAGGDFAKLAAEKSQDPGSAKEGGDLGYFAKGDMVPPFEAAAAALKIGDYTKTPVQTQFGFHVIKLEDKRKQKVPGFDEVKDQIRQAVIGERFTEMLAEVKKSAKIEITDPALQGDKPQ